MGVNLPHIIMQPLETDVGYETDDLTVVYWFHHTPDAILVNSDSQFQTLQDLIDHAEANPDTVTVSGSGTNSANHISQQVFDREAGISTTYITFGGTAPSVTALLGNQVQAAMGYTTVAAAQGDAVLMLAVAMEERHPAFPGVPTFRELGIDMVGGAYRGIAVPASTPEDIRQQLSDIIGQINGNEDFRQQMAEGGFVVIDVPYGEMDAFMAERQAEYEEIADAMVIERTN